MAVNPLIAQGTLNRIRASVMVANYPALNVTSGYLGKAGISLALQGDATAVYDTMTGIVNSPEPYRRVEITLHLLKTQALSGAWVAQEQATSLLGTVNIYPDSSVFPTYNILNASIGTVRELSYAGDDPVYAVTLFGIWIINNNLFNI